VATISPKLLDYEVPKRDTPRDERVCWIASGRYDHRNDAHVIPGSRPTLSCLFYPATWGARAKFAAGCTVHGTRSREGSDAWTTCAHRGSGRGAARRRTLTHQGLAGVGGEEDLARRVPACDLPGKGRLAGIRAAE
jgi:hypothetical protein